MHCDAFELQDRARLDRSHHFFFDERAPAPHTLCIVTPLAPNRQGKDSLSANLCAQHIFSSECGLHPFTSIPLDRYPEAAVLSDPDLCAPAPHCPRDQMHMWLWDPFRPTDVRQDASGGAGVRGSRAVGSEGGWRPERWGSRLRLVPRILNLAKDKARLVSDPERNEAGISGHRPAGPVGAGRGTKDEPRRLVVWSADLHIGPVGDVKELLRGHGVLVRC